MRRRDFLYGSAAAASSRSQAVRGAEPIPEPHFPSRLHQFVWRNWELANADRMAEVVRARPEDLLAIGASMGLPKKPVLTADQLARIYITVIRQNWHLLPVEQIVRLLGWTRQRFDFTLKEDDFLDVKLGPKSACPELVYHKPTRQEARRAAEIAAAVREIFGSSIHQSGEERFAFVRDLSDPRDHPARDPAAKPAPGEADLTRGWSIHAPGHPDLAARLRRYLADAMRAKVAETAAESSIELLVDPAAAQASGSFRVEITGRRIVLSGHDRPSLLQAIYWLEERMERRGGPFLESGAWERRAVWDPRYLYSYVALYGDPLMEPERDPFPDAYLEKLARRGVNGVWIQAVLNTLAPSDRFPEFGAGAQTRLKNLNALVARAARYGVRVFLYLNEPRAMPEEFFRQHPDIRGSSYRGLWSMCTSTAEVREWIARSLEHLFRSAPGLGGLFSITMSENHTNCFSHGGAWGRNAPKAGDCPRCSKRESWDVLAELIRTFRDGVRAAGSAAEVISWDWGWGDALAERLIPLLPPDTRYLSISEWEAPVRRGGVQTAVGEYSMSVVGPGPRARRNWSRARAAGIPVMAKTQFNNTWEISAVPYIPVLRLVVEHCRNLRREEISGVMPSWTCGGYPSPNLAAAKAYYFDPEPDAAEVLKAVAGERYGSAAAEGAVEAWNRFSDAFLEFPYGVQVYIIPTQHGPANLLRLKPTGHRPGMILFPHDGWRAWCGSYPPEVVQKQFSRLADLWRRGLDVLERALARTPSDRRRNAELDLAVARTCYHHFRSTANQVEFYLLRDRGERTPEAAARMKAIAREEIELARAQFAIARAQSVIAYEASNHYYYTPLDLVEKALNCRQVIGELERG